MKIYTYVIIGILTFTSLLFPILYYFHYNDMPMDKGELGTLGDFIGGMLNPILGVFNLIALLILSYYVSRSDDKRLLNQLRYDLYLSFTSEIKAVFADKEFYLGRFQEVKKVIMKYEDQIFIFDNDKLDKYFYDLITHCMTSHAFEMQKGKSPKTAEEIKGITDLNNSTLYQYVHSWIIPLMKTIILDKSKVKYRVISTNIYGKHIGFVEQEKPTLS